MNKVLILAFALLAWVGTVSAETPQTTFLVNSFADVSDYNIGDGICDSNQSLAGAQCTLRAAVQEANQTTAQDFIDLTPGTYTLSASLSLQGVVQISGNGIIDGGDQHGISVSRLTPTAGDATFFGVTLRNLTGLTCSRNSGCTKLTLLLTTVESSAAEDGGALTIHANELYLEEVTLQDNSATDDGGAIWARVNKVTILRSTISGNRANGVGGGVYIWPRGTTDFEMLVEQTTIDDNSAEDGGGIYFTNTGEAANVTKDIVITQSTISNNVAASTTQNFNHGGGIYVWSDVTLINSTVSGNRANESGGGIYLFNGSLALYNATITDNTADFDFGNDGQGGGISAENVPATIYRTVVSANEDNTSELFELYAPDCSGTVNSGGNNFVGRVNGNCTFNSLSSDQFSTSVTLNAKLGSLTNNGGLTATHMPQSDSPLVNSGATCHAPDDQPLTHDQRGMSRVQQGTCDIGAVESPHGTPTAVGISQQSAVNSERWMVTLFATLMLVTVALYIGRKRSQQCR